ncbi:MAG: putative monooxygenase [Nocardioides sp.]|nr:putative monooxygenase [Nocardioides sp.]
MLPSGDVAGWAMLVAVDPVSARGRSPGPSEVVEVDVCVVGAGQSGLALGFYLRRLNRRPDADPLSFVLLDDRTEPGGAWSEGWEGLALFSPAAYSSLAGWPMPAWPHDGTPTAAHVAAYLSDYEARYDLPVRRPHRVGEVRDSPGGVRLDVVTDSGDVWRARVVVNATGSWSRPFWPSVPGAEDFGGTQLHTAGYASASALPGQRVLVVGGGNSGAQIAADLLLHSDKDVVWATRVPPAFLPDDVDGRVLFEVATRSVTGAGGGVASLGDIVATPAVREARDRHGLRAETVPERITRTGAVWADGTERDLDTVVWCTGFRPALRHLRPLALVTDDGHPRTTHPRLGQDDGESAATVASTDDRVWFIGYGDWCAPASATLIGVNRSARDTAAAISARLLRS